MFRIPSRFHFKKAYKCPRSVESSKQTQLQVRFHPIIMLIVAIAFRIVLYHPIYDLERAISLRIEICRNSELYSKKLHQSQPECFDFRSLLTNIFSSMSWCKSSVRRHSQYLQQNPCTHLLRPSHYLVIFEEANGWVYFGKALHYL